MRRSCRSRPRRRRSVLPPRGGWQARDPRSRPLRSRRARARSYGVDYAASSRRQLEERNEMNVLGIKVRDRDAGFFTFGALATAVKNHRVELDDLALVSHDDKGSIRIEHPRELDPPKTTKKGVLVAALLGKSRDGGIDDAT